MVSLSSVVSEQFRMIAWVRLTHTRAAGGRLGVEAEQMVGAALILVWGPFVGLAMVPLDHDAFPIAKGQEIAGA